MQKIINGIAIFSGVVALSVVGVGGYVFIRKDAIIDSVKEKVMDAVMPDIGGGIMESIPDMTGDAIPNVPMPF
ncbi:plasmid stability protein [Eurybiavirus PHM1]|uniref:Plasmid stability protein n=1 Tax=Prochlorococcus phage P-HM1 TaxID=445700 RepID=E3SN24_9CAUD|nr:plasmid stability [Prochlorococcus phage P-HM1]ADO98817.1 plasmid stability protein [Prochlorococcus phage P-HM1]|tara:strand:- start:126 stop:344 length:219 start_codon:yes stop_codon:yes gene_type:complete